MAEKTRKITVILLYALSFLCCVLSVIMLLIPFTVTLEETVYAVPPGEYRTELTSESNDFSKNFFDYIRYLKLQDWSPSVEILFVISLMISIAVALAFVGMEVLLSVRKYSAVKKSLKILFLALSVFSLMSLILAIVIQADVSTWKVCGRETFYLKGYSGWKFYEETSVRGAVLLVPVIVFMFIAFSAQCSAGVLKLLSKKVQRQVECEVAECLDFKTGEKQKDGIRDFHDNDSIEELIKYKKLLDDGIITQVEFDDKKKKYLNL